MCRKCTPVTEKKIKATRKAAISRIYGLSWKEYVFLYESNDGMCHICGEPLALYKNENDVEIAHVDHDHDSGVVRGLLCTQCNLMLGCARESIGVLCEAISYLNRHRDDSWLEEEVDLD